MPRVKVDYVVSVSSEDSEHQANNLLATEVTKKKWLCARGEQSCSAVLQLSRAVMISAIHIGAHHAAFVEVLVGTSEKPNEEFEVLVPRCVFCGPSESRRDEPVQRVRSFSGTQLAEGARHRRWDRLRLLCSQPYNKHCQFGLSFVHIFEPENLPDPPEESKPVNPALTTFSQKNILLALGSYSSDEDDFRPGELFAKHQQRIKESVDNTHTSNTDAQIRQASSQAFKNIPDAETKLKKNPIAKPIKRESCDPRWSQSRDRSRESLMYKPDEEQPHGKIDRVVTKHKEQKKISESPKNKNNNIKKEKVESSDNAQKYNKDESFSGFNEKPNKGTNKRPSGSKTPQHNRDEKGNPARDRRDRKRQRSEDDDASGEPLRGVVFALSGFVQPERGQLREKALALGAGYRPDWTPDCTHLVCAFPNTPKQRKVAATSPRAYVVGCTWIHHCARDHKRLPEGQYPVGSHAHTQSQAHAPARPTPRTSPTPRASHPPDQEGDTDDEIEKVVREQKKRRREATTPSPPVTNSSQDESTSEGEATEREGEGETSSGEECVSPLPSFLDGYTLTVADEVAQVGFSADLLRRYAQAYGGLVLPEGGEAEEAEEAGESAEATLRLGTGPAQIRPDWLWRCHERRRLCPH